MKPSDYIAKPFSLAASVLLFTAAELYAHDDNYINFHFFNTNPANLVPKLTAVKAVPLNSIERFDSFNQQLACESYHPNYFGIATDDTARDSSKHQWTDSSGNKHAYSCINSDEHADILEWLSSTQFKVETSGRKLSYFLSTVTQTILDTVIDEEAPEGTQEALSDGSTLLTLSNPNEFSDGSDDANQTASLGEQLSFMVMTDLSFSVPWAEKNGQVNTHNVICKNMIFAHQLQDQSDVKWLTAAYTQGETIGSDMAVIEATDGMDIIMDADAAYTVGKDIYKLSKALVKIFKNHSNHVWWMGQYFNSEDQHNNYNFNSYYGGDSYSVAAQNLSSDQFQNALYCGNADGDPAYDFLMISTGHENADDDFEIEFVRLLNNSDENITSSFIFDGKTVRCPDAEVGTREALNGHIYTAVDDTSIRENYDVKTNPEAFAYMCTTKVTDMSHLFHNATGFNQDISTWDTGNVTDMSYMFTSAMSFNQPIGVWDTGSVTKMDDMFLEAEAFNQAVGTWETGSVTSMANMFESANAFNQPIGVWNTGNVTDMSHMFEGARAFNQPIGAWDTGNVKNMAYMFNEAVVFDQDLSRWCVEKITAKPLDFSLGSPLTADHEPVWGTCP